MNKFFVILQFVFQAAAVAYADCSTPGAVSGTMTWNATLSEMQYCDGSSWFSGKYGRITLRATLIDPSSVIIDTPNTAHALSGNNAFIVSNSTLFVLNATTITNVSAIAQVSFSELAGASMAVIDGNYLYVTATNSLRIFDISTPTSPTLVGSLIDATNLSASTKKIVVVGNYAYVLSGTRMVVINLTTKSSPALSGSVAVSNAQGIAADASYVYLSRSDTGLSVVDVTTPSSPTVVGTLTHANIYNGRGIAVSGNYVYTVGESGSAGSVVTIDVSTRTAPVYVSATINTMSNLEGVSDIYKFGSYLYAIQSNGRNSTNYVSLYSLSSPASITQASLAGLTGANGANCTKISLSSTRVLCTQNGDKTIHFFNSSAQNGNIGSDNLVNFSNKLGGAVDVVVSGTTAYIAAGTSSRLTTANISSPTSPTLSGSVYEGNMSGATGVALDGTSAYVITSNGGYSLVQLNVANPAAPTFVTSTNNFFANSQAYKIRVRNGVRYWSGSGMSRFSNSAGAQVNVGTAPYGFAFSNTADYAYVCLGGTSTLSVFSVSAPASMVSVGTVSDTALAGCRGVESAGNYLFVSSTTAPSNLSVWDITTPTSPVKVGSVLSTYLSTFRSMKVVGNNVYLTNSSRFIIFDVTTKSAPYLLDSVTISAGAWGFSVVGNYVYMANTSNKLEVYEVIPPINMGSCSKNGEFLYDYSKHAYKYCTNSNYLSMGPIGPGGAGCSSPVGKTGELRFNTATSKLRYCNGTAWTNVGLD
ncbi:LVIVD repeat-containing protein [Pseudobdellovibrio sp. HCB154]|uniref:LVIVD repeat-containing protein n=1 Tax=Pseudobdellovibrio sp. HCB154 TaxID=3386277 RepID=UPI003916FD3A